jgi:SET domain
MLLLRALVGSSLTLLINPFLARAVLSIPIEDATSTTDHGSALIAWMKSKGGFVSDKIIIRRSDPNDPASFMGVFATQAISVNETVLTVPRKCYIELEPEDVRGTDDYSREDIGMDELMGIYFANTCRLIHKFMKETQKWKEAPEESDYGPYLAYLATQPMGMLPATYSENGKNLLRKIQGRITKQNTVSENYGNYSLPPWQLVDWIDEQFVKNNCIEGDKPEQVHAVALAIQRGYDTEFIPIWDMFNHHNGLLNMATNSLRSEEGLRVWALRDIDAGQELFATYNYCTDCYDVGDDWGTPGIYRDFGFVEDFPQMWPFLDHDIFYKVVQQEKTGHVRAVFFKDPTTGEILEGLPDDKGLQYLRDELSRVAALDLEKELEGDLPPHEWDMIVKYHRSVITALTAGVEATIEEKRPEHREARDEL